MKISIMYADFSHIVDEKWPTVFGMKQWKRNNVSTPFDLQFSKSGGKKTNTKFIIIFY